MPKIVDIFLSPLCANINLRLEIRVLNQKLGECNARIGELEAKIIQLQGEKQILVEENYKLKSYPNGYNENYPHQQETDYDIFNH